MPFSARAPSADTNPGSSGSSGSSSSSDNALPPVRAEHDFVEGDHVTMPLFPVRGQGQKRTIRGVLQHIDITFRGRHYMGLVLLGEDKRYYKFFPEIAKRWSPP